MDQIKKNKIAYNKLLNKCWDEPEYLAKFREDPAMCLAEFGIQPIPGAKYHIVAPEEMKPSTNEDIYLPYMPKPEVTNLSAETLNKIAGGTVIPPAPEPETQDSTQVSQYTQVYQNVNYVENVDVFVEALVALVIFSQGDGQPH